MDTPARYQRQLLDQTRQIYAQTPITDATAQAFLATPRHLFVRRYRERASKEWYEVNQDNLQQHLATLFRAFKIDKTQRAGTEQHYFGLCDREHMSVVLALNDELISYGNATATERLLELTHRWVDLGMPAASSFSLRVYRGDSPVVPRDDQWVVKRQESQFLWSL